MQGAMKQFKDYQCIWDDNDDGLVSFIDGEEFQKCLTFMKKPSKRDFLGYLFGILQWLLHAAMRCRRQILFLPDKKDENSSTPSH